MAFEHIFSQSHNSSTSLGSTYSALDGVPFKIGSSFQPPSNISLPPELYNIKAPASLSENYSFDTEIGVLKWAQAKKDAAEAEQRAKEDALVSTIEGFIQPDVSRNSPITTAINSQFSSQTNTTSIGNNVNTVSSETVSNNLFVNVSSSILTPTPIPSNDEAGKSDFTHSQASGREIDVSLFEKEDDPFDNLELQTINDLEELKNVLDSNALESSNHSPSEQSEQLNTNNTNRSDGVYENVEVCDNTVKLSDERTHKSSLEEQHKRGCVYENVTVGQNGVVAINSLPDLDDGDYENLVQLSSHKATYKNPPSSISSCALPPIDTSLNHDITGNAFTKSVLPPIGKVGAMENSSENSNIVDELKSFKPSLYENVSVSSGADCSSVTVDVNNTIGSRQISRYSPTMFSIPDINASSLRSSKSSPDISNLSDIDNLLPDIFRNPAPRRPSIDQQWNKFSPLPDTHPARPVSKTPPPVSFGAISSDRHEERDPYSQLSSEQKKCVTSLMTMGFKKAKLSRAVEKLGTDAKEVINYLCNSAKLEDNGCDEELAETALYLCDQNLEKAQQYIDMYIQFKELGFTSDKIQDALIKNELDRDKALDILTA